MKTMLCPFCCVCALVIASCSTKKEAPAPAASAVAAPPIITASINGAASVGLSKTGVAGFFLSAGGDARALYSLTISGTLPNNESIVIAYYPSLTQQATTTSTPLSKITLAKPGLLVESTGALTGSASNNAATNAASGNFSGTLTDGTRISGAFTAASTVK